MGLLDVMGSEKIFVLVKVESDKQQIEGTNAKKIEEAFRFGNSMYGEGNYDLYFKGGQFVYQHPKGR